MSTEIESRSDGTFLIKEAAEKTTTSNGAQTFRATLGGFEAPSAPPYVDRVRVAQAQVGLKSHYSKGTATGPWPSEVNLSTRGGFRPLCYLDLSSAQPGF